MPDRDGRFVPTFFRAESWLRVFGQQPENEPNCDVEISWEPDFCLDGATFTPDEAWGAFAAERVENPTSPPVCDCRDHLDCDDAAGCKVEDLKE